MITAPATVTRFYGNTCFGLDVLENKLVALARVTLLNDPFDPYGFFETDFGNYINLSKYVQTHHPRDRGWFRVRVTAQSWGKTQRELQEYMADLRKNTFVLCASAPTETNHPKDNLYMWGHYGNGHRGLAIEFDTAALANVVVGHHCFEGNAPLIGEQPWVQMEYARSFRPISAEDVFQFLKEWNEVDAGRKKQPDQTSLDEYYRQLSVIKGDVWKSENEWRLMWRSTTETGSVYKIPITSECIRAVYLGLAMVGSEAEKAGEATARISQMLRYGGRENVTATFRLSFDGYDCRSPRRPPPEPSSVEQQEMAPSLRPFPHAFPAFPPAQLSAAECRIGSVGSSTPAAVGWTAKKPPARFEPGGGKSDERGGGRSRREGKCSAQLLSMRLTGRCG